MTRALSVSSLLALERCPRSWAAERVEGARWSGSRWTRIGNACHFAADAITRHVVAGTGRPLDEIGREAVLDFATTSDLATDEMHEALEIMERATAPGSTVTWGLRRDWTARTEVPLRLSDSFAPLPASSEDGAAYMGRIDRLQWSETEPAVETWDWKTGQDWMGSEDVLSDPQAQWYAFLTLAFFPGAVVCTFRRVMLRLGYTASVTFVRDEPWERRIRDRMVRGRERMLEVLGAPDAAEERPGPWCSRCPRIGACAAFRRVQERSHETSIDASRPREERARTMLALRAGAERLEESLRADVAENGPIPLGDGTELGLHTRRRTVLRGDRAAVLERLRSLGMDGSMEQRIFAPSDGALPKLVDAALEELFPSEAIRSAYRDELLGTATSFSFDVRGGRE